MAIFGKADAGLPIITQAVQVIATDDKELEDFWVRCVTLDSIAGIRQNSPVRKDVEKAKDGLFESTDTPEVFIPVSWAYLYDEMEHKARRSFKTVMSIEDLGEKGFESFREVCNAVAELIPPLCDRRAVLLDPLSTLHKARIQHEPIDLSYDPAVTTSYLDAIKQPHPELPFAMFEPRSRSVSPGSYIADEVSQFMLDLWRGKLDLKRCEECQYPFVVTRGGQQFCSHRCGDRVAKRRRRSKEILTEKV